MGDPQRKSIPPLALWLESCGIQVIFNRPRRPTDNAKVERMQRTTKNWAEIKMCQDIKQLNRQLKQTCIIQRELYKVSRLNNKTRKESYPQLYSNPRTYCSNDFDVQKAYNRLEKWTFVRRTSAIGQFSLYRQVYYLGKKYAKQFIAIKFDSDALQWNIFDNQGNLIKNIDAKKLNEKNIQNLTVNQRT